MPSPALQHRDAPPRSGPPTPVPRTSGADVGEAGEEGDDVGEAGEKGDASVSVTCGTTGERTGKTRRLTRSSDSGSNISADILSFSTWKWFTRNGEIANINPIWRAKDINKARFVCPRILLYFLNLIKPLL